MLQPILFVCKINMQRIYKPHHIYKLLFWSSLLLFRVWSVFFFSNFDTTFFLSCLLIQYGAHDTDVVCITNYVCHFKFDPIYILNQSGEEAYYITNNVRFFCFLLIHIITGKTGSTKMRSAISQNLILAFILCIEIVLIIQDLTINVWFLKSILFLFQQFDKNHIR